MTRGVFGARKQRVRRSIVATVVGLSLIAAACSSDDEDADSSEVTTATTAAPGTTAAPDTAAPDTTGAPDTAAPDTAAPDTTGAPDTAAPDTAAPDTTGAPDTAAAPLPETDPEATLHVTFTFPADTLDPHLEAGQGMRPYWRVAYDTLFEEKYASPPQPGLITDYEFSEDGLTFVGQLRDDVVFSDGTPVDAAAVAASLDRARGAGANPGVAGLLAAVTAVEATDEYEITITLSSYVPHLTGILAGPAGAIVNPAAYGDPEALKSQTAGSGPYQSVSFVPQQEAVYERSSVEYWQPEAGRLAGITITTVPDLQVTLNGLQSNEYDLIYSRGQIEAIEAVLGTDDYAVHDRPGSSAETVFLSSTRGALADPRVRQALNYAVDRDAIVAGIYGNDCAATGQNFPEGNPLHLDEAPYPFDPDMAQDLLAEAGADGATFELIDQGNALQVNLAAALQQMWNDIGLDVVQRTVPTGAFAEFAAGNLDTFTAGLAYQAHPNLALIRYFLPDGPFHLAAAEPIVSEAYAVIVDPSSSDEAIAAAYQDAAQAIVDNAYVVPICVPTDHLVTRPDVIVPENWLPAGTTDYRFLAVAAE